MANQTHSSYFCSQLSSGAGEQIFGTASRGDVWFLLEYRPAWEAEPLPNSQLPQAVKKRLSEYLAIIPHSRLHFIKHQTNKDSHLIFFVVVLHEIGPVLYKFSLASYDELLELDIPALLEGEKLYEQYLSQESLFLVCTHGKHDKCCAKFGRPVAKELAKHAGLAAWQVSHLGGDRFAANLVCFPYGVYYGRVKVAEVAMLVEEYRQSRVYLEKYRGRSSYNFITQAGEYFLRKETGILELPGFRLIETHKTGVDHWTLQFASLSDNKIHKLTIYRNPKALHNYLTCTAPKEANVAQYQLLKHQVI